MLRQLIQDQKVDPGSFFVPNGAQEHVINSVGDWNWEEHRTRIILAAFANGVGKTAVAANIINSIVNGPSSTWFDKPLFNRWPFSKSLRILGTTHNVRPGGSIDTELSKWLKKDSYSRVKAGKEYYSEYKFDSGFTLNVFTNNQDPMEMEGTTLGFVWVDEPCTQPQYQANITRLRERGGMILITATLVTENCDWVDEAIIDRKDNKKTIVLFASDEENCMEHGVRGQREHAEVEAMREHLRGSDPDSAAVRTGEQMTLRQAGLLFKQFRSHIRDGVHVQPVENMPDLRNCTIYQAVDPHDDRPWACIWFAADTESNYWVFAELPDIETYPTPYHRMTSVIYGLDHYHAEFGRIEHRWKISGKVTERFIDGRFANKKRIMEDQRYSLQDLLYDKYGIDFTMSNMHPGSRNNGIHVLKTLLSYDEDMYRPGKFNATGAPRLYILENCHNLIRALKNHGLKRSVSPHSQTITYKDEKETFKDFIDALIIGMETYPAWRGGNFSRRAIVETTPDSGGKM